MIVNFYGMSDGSSAMAAAVYAELMFRGVDAIFAQRPPGEPIEILAKHAMNLEDLEGVSRVVITDCPTIELAHMTTNEHLVNYASEWEGGNMNYVIDSLNADYDCELSYLLESKGIPAEWYKLHRNAVSLIADRVETRLSEC